MCHKETWWVGTVFKDVESKEILIWKHIGSETIKDYIYLKNELIKLGYSISSVTLDGKRGLYKAFNHIPKQMCHFQSKKDCTEIYHNETKARRQ